MTGKELAKYVERLLAEEGLHVSDNRINELYDYLTEGRDEVKGALATIAPDFFAETVELEQDQDDPRLWGFPALTRDPIRIVAVRRVGGRTLSPSSALDQDAGEYQFTSPRYLRLSRHSSRASVEVAAVLSDVPITAATTEAQIGLPTPCHRAIGKSAAVLALSAEPEGKPGKIVALYQQELDRLERTYGDFDTAGGGALRSALLASFGGIYGDTLY